MGTEERSVARKSMMGLVRKGKAKVRGSGYYVTWDVDSNDQAATSRIKYFVFGKRVRADGRERTYPGFLWKEGVRYLAQSAIFVLPHRLPEIRRVLEENGIDHDVEEVTLH